MDRGRKALPTLNKHTDLNYYRKCQNIHKKKLSSIKSSIDNGEPSRPAHLRSNLKKAQMKEERYSQIERENKILLKKMSYIMQNNALDNKNKSVKYGRSLNNGLRKRELQRITSENQVFLDVPIVINPFNGSRRYCIGFKLENRRTIIISGKSRRRKMKSLRKTFESIRWKIPTVERRWGKHRPRRP